MDVLPKSVADLIEELGKLPGVGPRTAERYAFFLLRSAPADASRLADAVSNLHKGVKICPVTYMLIDHHQEVSPLYDNPNRDKTLIAVVEQPLDVAAIEKTASFNGVYHVLGGVISPIDGVGPGQLNISPLLKRIKADKVSEVILATNASVEGESTALYLQKTLSEEYPVLKLSRLARGIPSGVDIEYADHVTLSRAMENRQKL